MLVIRSLVTQVPILPHLAMGTITLSYTRETERANLWPSVQEVIWLERESLQNHLTIVVSNAERHNITMCYKFMDKSYLELNLHYWKVQCDWSIRFHCFVLGQSLSAGDIYMHVSQNLFDASEKLPWWCNCKIIDLTNSWLMLSWVNYLTTWGIFCKIHVTNARGFTVYCQVCERWLVGSPNLCLIQRWQLPMSKRYLLLFSTFQGWI